MLIYFEDGSFCSLQKRYITFVGHPLGFRNQNLRQIKPETVLKPKMRIRASPGDPDLVTELIPNPSIRIMTPTLYWAMQHHLIKVWTS